MTGMIVAINEGINSSVLFGRGGKVLYAIEEERISRQKTPIGFPHAALAHGMSHLGLTPSDIEAVLFSNLVSPMTSYAAFINAYEAPFNDGPRRSDQELWRRAARFLIPDQLLQARRAIKHRAHDSYWQEELAAHGLGHCQIIRSNHHENHAASAYYGLLSHEERHLHDTLAITLDGGGDTSCAHVYKCRGDTMQLLADTPIGHSLGNIYSRVTHLLGFKPHEHEYKLMGMAPYVPLEYARPIADILHGFLGLDPTDCKRFKRKIAEPTHQIGPRLAASFRRMRFDSIAGGLQLFTEELLQQWIKEIITETGISRIVAAGGVFMNVKANMQISRLSGIDLFDVFPSCGDETLPFGAFWKHAAARSQLSENPPFNIYLGVSVADDLQTALDKYSGTVSAVHIDDPIKDAAIRIAQGDIIAWCQGRMEFGARALGSRSLLTRPDHHEVTAKINSNIKSRDFWMPFAPAMTRDAAKKFLNIPDSLPTPRVSPWMMHAFETGANSEKFIAAVHPYDRTARAQIVDPETAPRFHALLREVATYTGAEVLMNTSYNLHGSPICATSADAIDTMLKSGIDGLYLDNVYVSKIGTA
jgi:carbamoyltransferase